MGEVMNRVMRTMLGGAPRRKRALPACRDRVTREELVQLFGRELGRGPGRGPVAAG